MDLPTQFTNKIIRIFPLDGKKWLDELPNIYLKCVNKWNLSDCQISNILSYNLVVFAKSPAFGDVALKIGIPHRDLYTEMESINIYNGRNICKCYTYEKDLGALLLERIIPGDDLNIIKESTQRIKLAANLINSLPIPIKEQNNLPTFYDLMSRTFKKTRSENIVGAEMLENMKQAENYYGVLVTKNYQEVLLHGDLHHENMLRDQNGVFKAIDPKGLIGFKPLEVGRFIQNEFYKVDKNKRINHLEKMISIISNTLNETKEIIAIAAYLDCVISSCWSFEDNDPKENLKENVNRCNLVLNYLNSFNNSKG